MQPTINYSAPLKRSRTLQSGCSENDTMTAFLPYTTYPANGTDSTDISNTHLPMIAPNMAPSFTQTSISSYIPNNLESIAMTQEASHMSHMSHMSRMSQMSQMSQMSHQMSPNPSQFSAHGSPSMLNQMPRPLMPYIGISASTPPMDGMAPEVFLQSRSRVERAEANGFLGSDFDYVSVSAAGPSPSSYTSMTDNITMNSDTPFATPLYEYNQVPGSSNDGASDPLDASGGDDLVQCMGGLLHSSVCTSVVQWDGFGTDTDMDMNMERTMTMGTQQQQQQQQQSSFLDPDASASPLDHSALSSHRMERNTSSHRSNQSQRLREAARRQVSNADKIAILPKQDLSQQQQHQQQQRQSRNSTHPAVAGSVPLRETAKPSTSSQGTGTGKLVIAKTRRDRPKSKKLVCLYCTKHPEGFRGPHELARHYRRHHETGATRYICVDPRQRGIPTKLVLFKALEDCKNCREKKQYGVDYNAAVHLRRSHFKARQPRGKSGSDGNGAAPAPEQQADSNHFPPMDDLKDWIQEVTACPDQNPSTPSVVASYLQSPPADDTTAAMPAAAAVSYLQASPDDDYPLQSPPDDFVSDYHVVSGMNEQYDQETNGNGGSGLNFAFDDFVAVSYTDIPDVASQSAIPRQLADADTFFSMDEDYDLTGYSQASLDIDLHMHDTDMFLQPSSYDYDT